ncbi:MAG: hypothetical protein WC627_02680 [Legionella sp.]|jgi:hypothetical protein
MNIEVKGIDLSTLLIALFKNVYKKSESAITEESTLRQRTANDCGIYSIPTTSNIHDSIQGKTYLQKIGCVRFELAIPTAYARFYTLDVTNYDLIHQTGSNGVLTAEQVVIQLMAKESTPYQIGKDFPAAPSTSASANISVTHHSIFPKMNVENDKRFKKSQKPGILYEASSYSEISDDELESYGFVKGQWERKRDGIDNIVIVKNPNKKEMASSADLEREMMMQIMFGK